MMASMQTTVRRKYEHFPTSIYEDNYGYTINFYQPMIDYLDAKQRGTNPQYPHLPWSNERGLKKYWPCKSVRGYTSTDIKKYSDEVCEHAKSRERNFEDYKIIKRSPLAVTKSAIGARLSRRLGKSKYDSIEERTIRKLQEREDERRVANIMEDIERIKARYNMHKDLQISSGLKCAIRGKTANQITAAILAESEKNIKEARNEQEILISHAKQQHCANAKVIQRTAHIELIDDRLIKDLDNSVSTSLCDVKRQLHSFNQRTSDFYHDSRWRGKYL